MFRHGPDILTSKSIASPRYRRTESGAFFRHRDSGGGGPPCGAGWWRGRRPQRNANVVNLRGHASLFFNGNEATSPAPPPPRFARFASSSGPPPPLSRGRKVPSANVAQIKQRKIRVLAVRLAPDFVSLYPGYT